MRGVKRRTEGQSTAAWYAVQGRPWLEYQLERAKVNVRIGLLNHRYRARGALERAMEDLHLALMIHQQLKRST